MTLLVSPLADASCDSTPASSQAFVLLLTSLVLLLTPYVLLLTPLMLLLTPLGSCAIAHTFRAIAHISIFSF